MVVYQLNIQIHFYIKRSLKLLAARFALAFCFEMGGGGFKTINGVGGDVRNQNWFTFTAHSIEYALQYRNIVNTKENLIASV